MSRNSLTITDNRTGETYEVPIQDETINAIDLRKIKVQADEFGMMTYDPGFTNTASCKSRITYIDGDKGILEYRGYPIEQLAEHSNFLEVAYLIIHGELPTADKLAFWEQRIMRHTYIHENLTDLLKTFRYDAHPMGILVSAIASMSTLHPEAKQVHDPEVRMKQIYRIMGKLPTVAAFAYRHRIGRPYNYPDSTLGYAGNFLYMLDYMGQSNYQVNPVLAHALDVLFILHADHEQNCSTSAMRSIGSSEADPGDRLGGQHSQLHRPGEEAGSAADGLRPSGLQELRPPRPHYQKSRLRSFRGDRTQSAAGHSD
jgi:citrate synthase